MASFQLRPPAAFQFSKPEEWKKWKSRFEQFRLASELSEASDERQVSSLLYCMGEDAADVLDTTDISANNKKKYDQVISKFDKYFQVRKNIVYERANFNQANQLCDESAEQFITRLHQMAESCEFGNLKKEMIRDRLVIGVRDAQLSERLQLEPNLTLTKAEKMIRQRYAVAEQQHSLKQPIQDTKSQLDAVSRNAHMKQQRYPPSKKFTKARDQPTAGLRPPLHKCRRCGKGSHPGQQCPARDVTCHRCKRVGHYRSQCLSKTVAEVTTSLQSLEIKDHQGYDDDAYSDPVYLNIVTDQTSSKNSWNVQVTIVNKKVLFKVDTGADVTAMSDTALELVHEQAGKLERSKQQLCGPDHQPLTVIGTVTLTLSLNGNSCKQNVFVVKGLRNNLLGLPAIRQLKLLSEVNTVQKRIPEQYSELFTGLGTHKIKMKPDAKPYALFTPRHVPLPLRAKVQAELKRMETLGVISKVETPTPWCAGMVVVPKGTGAVRICVDLRPLNENVLREVHPIPKVETTLAQLSGARVFSKLDANSGFWQIPLDPESRLLTTFLTPFGRYCFNKLPFGICSAPELFQRCMSKILCGLPGIICHIDDILIYGRDQNEHDVRLRAALETIKNAGLTLNHNKCMFNQCSISFLGHLINDKGISQDPGKTTAIAKMSQPTTVTQLRRFLGMINQMSKFSSNLSQISQPLRELLSPKVPWVWEHAQQEAFEILKAEIATPRVLSHYSIDADTKISADASSHGLGAVLLQLHNGEWKPIAFASRSLSETERRYAQIEKEALALTWACEKFLEYVLGKEIELETDHKPLVPLLGKKSLDSLPPRVLRFHLRLMRFQYNIKHVPGKMLYTPDTLSRAPLSTILDNPTSMSINDIEMFVQAVTNSLPADKDRLNVYREAQTTDPECSTVIKYVL